MIIIFINHKLTEHYILLRFIAIDFSSLSPIASSTKWACRSGFPSMNRTTAWQIDWNALWPDAFPATHLLSTPFLTRRRFAGYLLDAF